MAGDIEVATDQGTVAEPGPADIAPTPERRLGVMADTGDRRRTTDSDTAFDAKMKAWLRDNLDWLRAELDHDHAGVPADVREIVNP